MIFLVFQLHYVSYLERVSLQLSLAYYFLIFMYVCLFNYCRLEQFNDVLLQENLSSIDTDVALFDASDLQSIESKKCISLEAIKVKSLVTMKINLVSVKLVITNVSEIPLFEYYHVYFL